MVWKKRPLKQEEIDFVADDDIFPQRKSMHDGPLYGINLTLAEAIMLLACIYLVFITRALEYG